MKRLLGIFLFLSSAVVFASPPIDSEVRARGEEFAAAWNKHNVKAMAEFWAPDGDLMNPYGRFASGRAEVEKLFADEHGTMMKKSTYKIVRTSVRALSSDMALSDSDVEISGITAPDGKALPTQKSHVTVVMKKASGKWWVTAARAFNEAAPPPAAKK